MYRKGLYTYDTKTTLSSICFTAILTPLSAETRCRRQRRVFTYDAAPLFRHDNCDVIPRSLKWNLQNRRSLSRPPFSRIGRISELGIFFKIHRTLARTEKRLRSNRSSDSTCVAFSSHAQSSLEKIHLTTLVVCWITSCKILCNDRLLKF